MALPLRRLPVGATQVAIAASPHPPAFIGAPPPDRDLRRSYNDHRTVRRAGFSLARLLSLSAREAIELRRDPVRLTLALVGTLVLMLVMGYGINMDVENLSYAMLDRDQTVLSQNYALNLSGSRYFIEKPPITDYEDLDKRMAWAGRSMT